MKRESHELQNLVKHYEQQLQQAPVPIWMDAVDLIDVLNFYEEQNLYFESEQCMRLALKLHPDHPEVLVRKAYRLKSEGRWADAIALVETIADQDMLEVRYFWAEVALSQLDFDKAEQLFNAGLRSERDMDAQLLAERGETPLGVDDLLVQIGELFMDNGSAKHAQRYLQQVTTDSPEYPRAQMLLAECAFQLGENEVAFGMLEKLLDEDPYYLDAWVLVADLAHETQDYARCAEAASFALAIDPNHEKAARFKAIAALAQNQFDEVLEVYDNFYPLFPHDYTMALSAGEILINKAQYAKAREVLSRANQVCPNDNPDKARIVSDIAMTHAAQGDMATAYESLLGCCSLGSNFPNVQLQAARMAVQFKHHEFATKLLDDYFKHYSLAPDAHLELVKALCEHEFFPPHIWDILFDVVPEQHTASSPYLAFAAHRMALPSLLHRWVVFAAHNDPLTTRWIFSLIYPNTTIEQVLMGVFRDFPYTPDNP